MRESTVHVGEGGESNPLGVDLQSDSLAFRQLPVGQPLPDHAPDHVLHLHLGCSEVESPPARSWWDATCSCTADSRAPAELFSFESERNSRS